MRRVGPDVVLSCIAFAFVPALLIAWADGYVVTHLVHIPILVAISDLVVVMAVTSIILFYVGHHQLKDGTASGTFWMSLGVCILFGVMVALDIGSHQPCFAIAVTSGIALKIGYMTFVKALGGARRWDQRRNHPKPGSYYSDKARSTS